MWSARAGGTRPAALGSVSSALLDSDSAGLAGVTAAGPRWSLIVTGRIRTGTGTYAHLRGGVGAERGTERAHAHVVRVVVCSRQLVVRAYICSAPGFWIGLAGVTAAGPGVRGSESDGTPQCWSSARRHRRLGRRGAALGNLEAKWIGVLGLAGATAAGPQASKQASKHASKQARSKHSIRTYVVVLSAQATRVICRRMSQRPPCFPMAVPQWRRLHGPIPQLLKQVQ